MNLPNQHFGMDRLSPIDDSCRWERDGGCRLFAGAVRKKRAHLRESGVAGWDFVAGARGRRKSMHVEGAGLRVRERSGPQGLSELARRGDFATARISSWEVVGLRRTVSE